MAFANIDALGKNRDGVTDFRVLSRLQSEIKDMSDKSDFGIVGIAKDKEAVDQNLAGLFDLELQVNSGSQYDFLP